MVFFFHASVAVGASGDNEGWSGDAGDIPEAAVCAGDDGGAL